MTDPMDAQQVAEAVRDRMLASDRASRALGLRVTVIAPGQATLVMAVRNDMLNGMDICHGGVIGTLADSAFAFACNAGNELTVASGFSIDLFASAREGDVLTATAREVTRGGRLGLYDVDVVNQEGVRVAVFRGRSYAMKGRSVLL